MESPADFFFLKVDIRILRLDELVIPEHDRMDRRRKGMVIKNTDRVTVAVELATRKIALGPGEQLPISAEEVKDTVLREKLQERAISIVRPTTEAEEAAVRELLEAGGR